MADIRIRNRVRPAGWLIPAVTVILAGQLAASYAIAVGERQLGVPSLQATPEQIGSWRMVQEQALEPLVMEQLQPDDYVLRDYRHQRNGAQLSMFIAYFKSLQNTYGPHSPRVCLPGAGWLTKSWTIETIPVLGRPEGIPVNRYALEKSGQQILVVYWYQNDRRVWAEEFRAKLHLLPDLLQYRRSDVSLVRIVVPLTDGSAETAWKAAMEFASDAQPVLAERLALVR